MSNIFTVSSIEQKKKITFIAIYATIAVIVCLLTALLITQVVANKNTPEPSGGEVSDPAINFTEETVTAAQLHSGNLVLVNKDNEYIFGDNTTPINIAQKYPEKKFGLSTTALTANATALAAFNEMMNAAYANIPNADIVVQEAYRSREAQEENHSKNPTEALPAGFSDFHTGLSFWLKDNNNEPLCSEALEGKYDWIYENAHKYGFIVRYPESKKDITAVGNFEQVFRYVGVVHATYIYQNSLCLEEYLELLRATYSYESPLSVKGADGKSYQVYYAAPNEDSKIMVSTRYGYEISGDNMNGYIVTINKSTKATVKN